MVCLKYGVKNMEEVVETKEKWVCPNCGEKMELSYNTDTPVYVCPACGCTVSAEEQNFENTSICPNCNQEMDGNECPYCGYDLGSDFD